MNAEDIKIFGDHEENTLAQMRTVFASSSMLILRLSRDDKSVIAAHLMPLMTVNRETNKRLGGD